MTPEGRIKAIVNKGLDAICLRHPKKVWRRMPVLRGMGLPFLDYHLCVNGHTVAIETKRDSNHRLSAQQHKTKTELEDAGAYVFVIYDQRTADYAIARIEELANRPWLTS